MMRAYRKRRALFLSGNVLCWLRQNSSCYLLYHSDQRSILSLELARLLGVTQNTAWKISHKMMQVMHEREAEKHLTGRVEMGDGA